MVAPPHHPHTPRSMNRAAGMPFPLQASLVAQWWAPPLISPLADVVAAYATPPGATFVAPGFRPAEVAVSGSATIVRCPADLPGVAVVRLLRAVPRGSCRKVCMRFARPFQRIHVGVVPASLPAAEFQHPHTGALQRRAGFTNTIVLTQMLGRASVREVSFTVDLQDGVLRVPAEWGGVVPLQMPDGHGPLFPVIGCPAGTTCELMGDT